MSSLRRRGGKREGGREGGQRKEGGKRKEGGMKGGREEEREGDKWSTWHGRTVSNTVCFLLLAVSNSFKHDARYHHYLSSITVCELVYTRP